MAETDNPNIQIVEKLFETFCAEEHVADAQRHRLNYPYFYKWLVRWLDLRTAATLAEEVAVSLEAAEAFKAVIEAPDGPQRLVGAWPFLCNNRRPCDHNLVHASLNLLMRWADHTVATITVAAHRDAQEDHHLGDAEVQVMLMGQMGNILDAVANDGLDGIHDKAANTRFAFAPDVFDYLEGLLAKQEATTTREMARQLLRSFRGLIFREVLRPGGWDISALAQPEEKTT